MQAYQVPSLLTLSLLSSFPPGLIVQLWSSQNLVLYPGHSLVLCQGHCFLFADFSSISDLFKRVSHSASCSVLLEIISLEPSAVILFPVNWNSLFHWNCWLWGLMWRQRNKLKWLWSLWEDFVPLNGTEGDRQALGGRYVTGFWKFWFEMLAYEIAGAVS